MQELINDGQLPRVDFAIGNQGQNIYDRGILWEPWIEYMRSVNFSLAKVNAIENVLRHVDVSPCSIQIDRHDFSLRWWVKGGSSWSDCATIYDRVCNDTVQCHVQ